MTKFEFSKIKINLTKPNGDFIGFASGVLNDAFFCGGIAIHGRPFSDSIRLVYPISKTVLGVQFPLFHPLSKSIGDLITEKIFIELKNIEKKVKNHDHSKISK